MERVFYVVYVKLVGLGLKRYIETKLGDVSVFDSTLMSVGKPTERRSILTQKLRFHRKIVAQMRRANADAHVEESYAIAALTPLPKLWTRTDTT